jgi:hypothetical protein
MIPTESPTAPLGKAFSLPSRGFAVQRKDDVVLYSLSGNRLRRLPHTSILPTAHASPTLQDRYGRRLLLQPGPVTFSTDARSRPAIEAAGPHCDRNVSRAGTVRVCARRLRHDTFRTQVSVVTNQQVRQLPSHPPGSHVGHWRYGDLSSDGRYVLMGWSGECESQSAYLADLASGSVDPLDRDANPAETVALGWLSKRASAVFYPSAGCGRTVPVPGIYKVSTTRTPQQLIVGAGENAVMWG